MNEREQRDCVRELGRQVHALAVSEEYEARRRRWRDVNGLRKPDRAPVWCKPVDCWKELLPEERLQCSDAYYRPIERALRRALIKQDIGDDSLFPVYWPVEAAVDTDGPAWGVEIRHIAPTTPGGAWRHDPPIRDEADLASLRPPRLVHDAAESRRRLDRAATLFDGVMPVRLVAAPPLLPHIGHLASELLGLDAMLLNLALKPEMMHRLMRFLHEGIASALDQIEAMGLLTPTNDGEMHHSDPLGGPGPGLKLSALWVHSNSQEFDQVSPAMLEEFQLAYERPLLERFGLCAFGCCENLTHKISQVLTIRNLRVFVCSAWTDLDQVIAACGRRYTIMWRQKASDVVFAPDAGPIRRHLEDGARRLRGHYYQIVLRELQTLRGDRQRLHTWTAAAKDAAERFA